MAIVFKPDATIIDCRGIIDNGPGIAPLHTFEPFFTTKGVEKGNLGL
jgi:C4-dicarboxylate-specific signal transduction histidine kinase